MPHFVLSNDEVVMCYAQTYHAAQLGEQRRLSTFESAAETYLHCESSGSILKFNFNKSYGLREKKE